MRLGRATWSEDAFSEAPSATFLTTVFMEVSSVFVTPKRKYSRNSSCSSTEASPEEKRAKEASSPDGFYVFQTRSVSSNKGES